MLKGKEEFSNFDSSNKTDEVAIDEIYNDIKEQIEADFSASVENDELSEILNEVLQNEKYIDFDANHSSQSVSVKSSSTIEASNDEKFNFASNNQELENKIKNEAEIVCSENQENNTLNINSCDDIVTIISDKVENDKISFDKIKNSLKYKNVNIVDLDSANHSVDKANTNEQQNENKIELDLSAIDKKLETFNFQETKSNNARQEFLKNATVFSVSQDYDTICVQSESFMYSLETELSENYESHVNIKQTEKKQGKAFISNIFSDKLKARLNKTTKTKEDIHEFDDISKYSKVKFYLLKEMRTHLFSCTVSSLCFLSVLLLSILFRFNFPALKNNVQIYITLNLIFLLFSSLSCWKMLKIGFKSIFNFHNYSLKTQLAFLSFICVVHNIIAIFNVKYFSGEDSYIIFNLLVILAILLASMAKFTEYRRVLRNFNFINSKRDLFCLDIYDNEKNAQDMIKGIANYQAKIAYYKKTDFAYDFIKSSTYLNPFDKLCNKVSPISIVCGIIVSIIYAIKSKDIIAAFTVLSLCSCITFPFAGILSVNLLFSQVCKKTNIMGGMISGYSAVKKFSETNALALDASTLYPKETVYLHKIKGIASESVDYLVPYIAAILIKAKSPLAPIFYNLIRGKHDILPQIDSLSSLDSSGIEAWIQGRRILIGDRLLMADNCIHVPHRETEERYIRENKQITYVSFANELVCMLVTSYKVSNIMIQEMQRLEDNGVNLLINSNDPNISSKNIANNFRIFFRSVKILPKELWNIFKKDIEEKEQKAKAELIITPRIIPFVHVITSCIRLKSSIVAMVTVQAACLILCFCTALFIIFYSGVCNFHLLEVFLYALFWCVPVFLISKLRK